MGLKRGWSSTTLIQRKRLEKHGMRSTSRTLEQSSGNAEYNQINDKDQKTHAHSSYELTRLGIQINLEVLFEVET